MVDIINNFGCPTIQETEFPSQKQEESVPLFELHMYSSGKLVKTLEQDKNKITEYIKLFRECLYTGSIHRMRELDKAFYKILSSLYHAKRSTYEYYLKSNISLSEDNGHRIRHFPTMVKDLLIYEQKTHKLQQLNLSAFFGLPVEKISIDRAMTMQDDKHYFKGTTLFFLLYKQITRDLHSEVTDHFSPSIEEALKYVFGFGSMKRTEVGYLLQIKKDKLHYFIQNLSPKTGNIGNQIHQTDGNPNDLHIKDLPVPISSVEKIYELTNPLYTNGKEEKQV